jgi:UDP-N-acetylglucosamine--N-acetylmuramyl-(pentapeptide) pyrophosphoryl-undecaprenol N-acetylglucosamine transferase
MSRPRHIVFAGGVTPSHLQPGLAVATHLVERYPDAQITFVGGTRLLERHIVRAAGFGYANVPSQPAPQRPMHAVRFLVENVAGYWAARWLLKEHDASLVVGLGGPASAPAVRAAISCGIPTVMLEQNIVPGRVTRWLARSASSVCLGFVESTLHFPSAVPVTVTGNPAPPEFERLYRERNQRVSGVEQQRATASNELDARQALDLGHPSIAMPSSKRLIIIGGAGGARSLNESMPGALARLRMSLDGWQIVHQTGEGQLQETERRYRDLGLSALVVAYVDEMASIMFDADLVVCRSAGTTLAELALAGVPALLVPYPPAIDYQMPNAEVFAAAGAARILDETTLPGSLIDALVDKLEPLVGDDARREKMAANMCRLAAPHAAANVADSIVRILSGATVPIAA